MAKRALERFQSRPEAEGERKTFPHCPRCASYALYRRNNVGNYECESCGLEEITEVLARRPE
jgi:hypothetical protein